MSNTPFLNYRALLLGGVLLSVLTLLTLATAWLWGVEKTTAPQLLTLSALWIVPGLYSALRAADGRMLHGMLTGMLGALLVVLALQAVEPQLQTQTVVSQLAASRMMVLLVLGGLWGSIGGLFAEIVHLRRMRKRAKPGGG